MKLIITITLIVFVFLFKPANAIEISDFKYGLVCPDNETKSAWICHETKNIKLTGQALCTFNKQKVPCTWYGFSFKYKNHDKNKKINCASLSSSPSTLGDPNRKGHISSREQEFGYFLKSNSGFHMNPQYSVYAIRNKEDSNVNYKIKCTVEDTVAYEYDFTITYPSK